MLNDDVWEREDFKYDHQWTDWGIANDARKRAVNAQDGVEFLISELKKANDRITLLELEILAISRKENKE